MKKNNFWKRFWTLNVHNHEGFTLVELIIVIAILAILSSVAVVGYSSYIKKANMQADKTMIAEIENALMLAGYSGTFAEGEGGYIVLSTDGVANGTAIEEGSALDVAMDAAFGDNWRTTLKLKYNDWGNNGLFNNLMPLTAHAVVNSSYLTGNRQDKLLSDVEILTGMSQKLVDFLDGADDENNKTFSDIFTQDGVCVLDETAAKYGITKDQNETWEQWAGKSPENKTAYGNLLVMAAADEFDKYSSTVGTDNEYQMTSASSTILLFSSYYAFAAQNPEFSPVLDQYMGHLDGTDTVPGLAPVTDSLSGAAWFASLEAAASSHEGYEEYANSQAGMDQVAFLAIMGGLGNPTEDQATQVGSDMRNPNLFTDGTVNGMYNDFLAGAEAVAGTFVSFEDENTMTRIDLANGNVAILVVMKDGNLTVVDSIS